MARKKGSTVSPETRAKMKEAAKRRWAERKAREQEVIEKEQALENYHKGNVVPPIAVIELLFIRLLMLKIFRVLRPYITAVLRKP